VNLIGDHTDYAEGLVLPMAIDHECVVIARARRTPETRARSMQLPGEVVLGAGARLDQVEPRWGRFVAGAIAALSARGVAAPPAELVVTSDVPAGSGLSSSSALSVALVLALGDLAGAVLARTEVARIAGDAETLATGVRGGLMDQLTAVHGVRGRALVIDCRRLRTEPVPLPSGVSVLVAHSGVPRSLADSAYSARRAAVDAAAARLGVRALRDATLDQVEDDPIARHVVTENARVVAFARALVRGDLAALGRLMLESHASLRDDFAVSTPELDALVESFVSAGALGARLTGAGFGGCVVALAASARAAGVMDATRDGYRSRTGIETIPVAVEATDGAGPAPVPVTSWREDPPSSGRTPPG
jgi:galactokinase